MNSNTKLVYCKGCRGLLGFQYLGEDTSEINQVQFIIGNKKYPKMDIKHLPEELIIVCEACGTVNKIGNK